MHILSHHICVHHLHCELYYFITTQIPLPGFTEVLGEGRAFPMIVKSYLIWMDGMKSRDCDEHFRSNLWTNTDSPYL